MTREEGSLRATRHVPVSTSQSLSTSSFPHVMSIVSSGLHVAKDTGFVCPSRMCFNESRSSSPTWNFSELLLLFSSTCYISKEKRKETIDKDFRGHGKSAIIDKIIKNDVA